MPLDMTRFQPLFFEEAAEHLSTLESLLLHLDPQHPDPEQLADISRAAHSIKGSGSTFGFHDLAGPAQEIQSLVARARMGGGRLSGEALGALHEASDALRALLAERRGEVAGQTNEVGVMAEAKVSPQDTATNAATDAATDAVMALIEVAGAGGLGDIAEAVRGLGEAIERNAALAEQAVDNAEMLRENFHATVLAIAALALSRSGGRPASGPARPRPVPKLRRAPAGDKGRRE